MDCILLSEHKYGIRVAHIKDGVLSVLFFDPHLKQKQAKLDDIVSGRVLASRHDFVWIDAGLDKECVIKTAHFYGKVPPEGTYIWAQVTRLPWPEVGVSEKHEKGYRLTPRITIVGKFWVYTPTAWTDHKWKLRSHVSEDEINTADVVDEKKVFEDDYKRLQRPPSHTGFFKYALNRWQRFIRDSSQIVPIFCETSSILGDVRQFLSAQNYINWLPYAQVANQKQLPLFDYFGIEDEWQACLSSNVSISGGGSLDIRECSAATLIDVNVGSDISKPFDINVKVLKELQKQVLWRDLSGNILVDFIRMSQQQAAQFESHVKNIFQNTDIKVMGTCALGLMQLQRKRLRPSLRMQLMHLCPNCYGEGIV